MNNGNGNGNGKIPTPVLIYGDHYLSNVHIVKAKEKYDKYRWVTMSATSDSPESIRAEVGTSGWDDTEKIVLITELPNQKAIREFLIHLCKNTPEGSHVVIWDSNNIIKASSKTWMSFVRSIRGIKGGKVVDNGEEFTEKESDDCVTFVKKCFARNKLSISDREANLLISMVGYDRGLLTSEIEKLSLTSPDIVTSDFIMDYAFPITQESVLYKLGNVLDTASYEDSINTLMEFVESGVHPYLIGEILVRKARWQMAATYYWTKGVPWNIMIDKLMDMGKFPSIVWHSTLDRKKKQDADKKYKEPQDKIEFLHRKQGIPRRYFHLQNLPKEKKEEEEEPKPKKRRKGVKKKAAPKVKKVKAETIPMRFMAQQTVQFVRTKIVAKNTNTEDVKVRVMRRAMKVYLLANDKLADLRHGDCPLQDLQDVVRALTNLRTENFE